MYTSAIESRLCVHFSLDGRYIRTDSKTTLRSDSKTTLRRSVCATHALCLVVHVHTAREHYSAKSEHQFLCAIFYDLTTILVV